MKSINISDKYHAVLGIYKNAEYWLLYPKGQTKGPSLARISTWYRPINPPSALSLKEYAPRTEEEVKKYFLQHLESSPLNDLVNEEGYVPCPTNFKQVISLQFEEGLVHLLLDNKQILTMSKETAIQISEHIQQTYN